MSESKSLRLLDDNDALQRAQSDYTQARGKKSDALERTARYLKIYMAQNPPDEAIDSSSGTLEEDESIQADTYIAVGAAVADSGVRKIFNLLFSDDDWFKIVGSLEDSYATERITAHMRMRHREMKFRHKVYEILQIAVINDYAVSMARWLLEPGYEDQKVDETVYKQLGKLRVPFRRSRSERRWVPDKVDRPDMVVFPFDMCFHDWTAKDGFNDSRFFIDDRWESLENLKENQKTSDRPWGKYTNVDAVLKEAAKAPNDSLEIMAEGEEELDVVTNRKVKVHRYWTRDHVLEYTMGIIIRRSNLSGWPLQLWKITNLPSKFEGMGLIQRMERNQYDINASLNSRRNFQNLVSDPFGAIHEDLVADQDGAPRVESGKLLTYSGNRPASEMFSLHNPGVNINQGASEDIALQMQTAQELNTISDNDLGSFASGRRSATEVQKVAISGLSASQIVAINLEETAIEPYLDEQFRLERYNLTKNKRFLHFGQHGDAIFQITPGDYQFRSEPLFYAQGTLNSTQDAVNNQQFQNAMQIAMSFPDKHNWDNILVEMWKMNHPKEYWQFVRDPNKPTHNVPAQMENWLIANGKTVEVSPENNDAEHLAGHAAAKRAPDYRLWPEDAKARLAQHEEEHRQAQVQAVIPQQQNSQDSADSLRGLRPPGPQAGVA